jgi:hypothetical protein
MVDGGVQALLIAALVAGAIFGGAKAVKETNRHVVRPIKHAIVHVVKKI